MICQENRVNSHTTQLALRRIAAILAAKGGRVVVDEASMLGHKDAVRLVRLAEKLDLKLVFLGDQVSDNRGSSALSREDADSLLADYRGYMCWRFGAVGADEIGAGHRADQQ